MGETIEKEVKKLPSGLPGFAFGFVIGLIAYKVAEYLVSVADPKRTVVTPVLPVEQWLLLVVSVFLVYKKPSFGAGFAIGWMFAAGFLKVT